MSTRHTSSPKSSFEFDHELSFNLQNSALWALTRPSRSVRYIGAVIAQFSMAPSIRARTDKFLAVPSAALAHVENLCGIERCDVPFDLALQEFSVFGSATSGDAPEIAWFQGHVLKAAKVLAPID